MVVRTSTENVFAARSQNMAFNVSDFQRAEEESGAPSGAEKKGGDVRPSLPSLHTEPQASLLCYWSFVVPVALTLCEQSPGGAS